MKAWYKLALNGSVLAALTVLVVVPACSDSNKDDTNGSSGSGGHSTAGSSNSGAGKSQGGDNDNYAGETNEAGTTGTPEGGAGGASQGGAGGEAAGGAPLFGQGGDSLGAGGVGTGPTVAKFCNDLSFGPPGQEQPTTMILEVSSGGDKVSFTAKTGKCVPADGLACKEIPTGEDVLVELFDADDPTTAIDSAAATIGAGKEVVFYTTLDESGASPQPIWAAGVLPETLSCQDVTFDEVYPTQ